MSEQVDQTTWAIARALADPRKQFALVIIHQGFCTSREEFAAQFEDEQTITEAIDSLIYDGLVEEDASTLRLSSSGRQAIVLVAPLNDPERRAILEHSVVRYRGAVQFYSEESYPERWASLQAQLARDLDRLSLQFSGDERALLQREAEEAIQSALHVYTAEGYPERHADLSERLARLQARTPSASNVPDQPRPSPFEPGTRQRAQDRGGTSTSSGELMTVGQVADAIQLLGWQEDLAQSRIGLRIFTHPDELGRVTIHGNDEDQLSPDERDNILRQATLFASEEDDKSERVVAQEDKDSDDPLAALERRLGHIFARRQLLVNALTHRSYAYEFAATGVVNNERLEFLGDAVLALISADLLFARYAQADEGMLTQYRAALVQAATLARFAEALELAPHLRLGRGEDAMGGRTRTPLLAAAFEAVLGALYLDGGMMTARAFLEPYLLGELGRIEAAGMGPRIKDAKSRLQELAQGALGLTPRYQLLEESGPSHDRTFVVQALIGDVVVGQGTGKNKRQAEQAAALAALADPGWRQSDSTP